VAERSIGRRNRVGTVIVTRVEADTDEEVRDEHRVEAATRLAQESARKAS
jgi:hypothetical protein